MSNVIDSLQVVFTADTGGLTAKLSQITSQLVSLQGVTQMANASLAALGGAVDFSVESLKSGAYSAGAAVGEALAAGLYSRLSEVRSAASALSQAASVSGGTSSGGSKTAAANRTSSTAGRSSGGSGGDQYMTVTMNVDGVKLGEACIKGVNKVAAITGHTMLLA